MRNTPSDCTDAEINAVYEGEPGPLSRLFRGLGDTHEFAPIPTVKPIDVMPVEIDLRVEQESYIDCNGKRCWRPKGEGERQRIANGERGDFEFRAHTQAVYEEVQGRRLDEIDADWRDRFTFEQAESFYRLELNKLVDADVER